MRSLFQTVPLIAFVVIYAFGAQAEEAFKCGEYNINGVVKKSADHFVIKLYEGTMSEVSLSLSPDLEEAVQIYADRAVTLHAKMMAPVKNMRGYAQSLLSEDEIKKMLSPDQPFSARFFREDIQERVPDPIRPELDSGMVLVKEVPCDNRAPSSNKSEKNKKGRS
ncbi:MAG: hypothetical protein ACKOX6_02930 [Bdellovibrio sp.]